MSQATITNPEVITEQQEQMKANISAVIKETLKEKDVSIRSLAKNVDMKHPQILRITKGDNYTMDTLARVLVGLDLEIVVRPKNS